MPPTCHRDGSARKTMSLGASHIWVLCDGRASAGRKYCVKLLYERGEHGGHGDGSAETWELRASGHHPDSSRVANSPYPTPVITGGEGMSQDGHEAIGRNRRAVATGAEGTPEPTTKVLAAELWTHPKLLLEALEELRTLGSQSRPRVPEAVDWARGLVHQVLRAFGFRDRWPNIVPVAQGSSI